MSLLLFSKSVCWSSSHRYIHAVFFRVSYSTGLNSSLSDNHKFPLLITRGVLGCFLGGGNRCLFLPGLSRIFVGHAPLSPPAVWVSVSSAHVFLGAGQSRRRAEFASVVFGHAFSHTAFQTDLLTSTHLRLFFPSPPPSILLSFFPFFLSPRATHHKIAGYHEQAK